MLTLKQKAKNGDLLEATFQEEKGLRLISFKRAGYEVIDQKSENKQQKGIIGPHLNQKIGDFPWQVKQNENKLTGILTSKDIWKDKPITEWLGTNFKMFSEIELTSRGLILELSIVSDTDSLIGYNFCYSLPKEKGTIESEVKEFYYDPEIKLKKIPKNWNYSSLGLLAYSLDQECNYAFHPLKDPLRALIVLQTEDFAVTTRYSCNCQENSWQVVHSKESDSVSINPLSSQNPWRPNLSVSSIRIEVGIA